MIINIEFSWAKGDISISTLIAVLIGIIVLGLIIYLMFFYSKESSFDCRLCSAKFAEWCQRCLTTEGNWGKPGWSEPVPMSDYLDNCKEDCLGINFNDCGATGARDKCKGYIYIPPITTTT